MRAYKRAFGRRVCELGKWLECEMKCKTRVGW